MNQPASSKPTLNQEQRKALLARASTSRHVLYTGAGHLAPRMTKTYPMNLSKFESLVSL